MSDLDEAAAVAHEQVQAVQVERLLADGGAGGDGRAPLLHEGQQALHPAAPLGRVVHLVQLAQRVRLLAQDTLITYPPARITLHGQPHTNTTYFAKCNLHFGSEIYKIQI